MSFYLEEEVNVTFEFDYKDLAEKVINHCLDYIPVMGERQALICEFLNKSPPKRRFFGGKWQNQRPKPLPPGPPEPLLLPGRDGPPVPRPRPKDGPPAQRTHSSST